MFSLLRGLQAHGKMVDYAEWQKELVALPVLNPDAHSTNSKRWQPMQPPDPATPDESLMNSSASEVTPKLGYAQPLAATRFRQGQSGNPRGRPEGSKNLKTLLKRALNALRRVKPTPKDVSWPGSRAGQGPTSRPNRYVKVTLA
jgi:hypothetical protein